MTSPTLYTDRSNAKRAAKKALGHTDFEVVKTTDGKFYWIDTSAAAAEAAGAENDPPLPTLPEPEVSILEPALASGGVIQPNAEGSFGLMGEATSESTLPADMVVGMDFASGPDRTVEYIVDKDGHVEAFHEVEPKADLTIDLGITPELADLIYELGETAGAAIPVPKKRRGITAQAWEAATRGELPAPLDFPPSNAYATKHAANLLDLAKAGDEAGLHAYFIGGTNTYSKALRDYREALLAFLATVPAKQEAA